MIVFSIILVGVIIYYFNVSSVLKLYKNALNENEKYYDLAMENNLGTYYECSSEYSKIKSYFIAIPVYGLKKGKVYIWYSKFCSKAKDSSDDTSGSLNIPVELDIEKIDGKWKIVKLYEEP